LPSRREILKASGQKWRGLGGGNFCPRAKAKPRRPALWARKPKQKNFLFLLEEKIGRAQNKKCRENFSARQAAVLGGWRRDGAIGFFQEFLIK